MPRGPVLHRARLVALAPAPSAALAPGSVAIQGGSLYAFSGTRPPEGWQGLQTWALSPARPHCSVSRPGASQTHRTMLEGKGDSFKTKQSSKQGDYNINNRSWIFTVHSILSKIQKHRFKTGGGVRKTSGIPNCTSLHRPSAARHGGQGAGEKSHTTQGKREEIPEAAVSALLELPRALGHQEAVTKPPVWLPHAGSGEGDPERALGHQRGQSHPTAAHPQGEQRSSPGLWGLFEQEGPRQ